MEHREIVKLAKIEATHYEYHGDDFICFYVVENNIAKYKCVNDEPWENCEDRLFSDCFYKDLKLVRN